MIHIEFIQRNFNKTIFIIYKMESYHKRKRLLEEKYGKLIYLKPYKDVKANNKIADNKHQNYVKEITRCNRSRRIKKSI